MILFTRMSGSFFCGQLTGCAGGFGMQWHADVTLASYVARKDDEITNFGHVLFPWRNLLR